MAQVLEATFEPAELKALWNIKPTDWGTLQSRGYLYAGSKPNQRGKGERVIMNVVQAAALGVQTALTKEWNMDHVDAAKLAKECAVHIEALMKTPGSSENKEILYVVTGGDKPKWKRVGIDDSVHDVIDADPEFAGRPCMLLDVKHYLSKVCEAVAQKEPEKYAKWQAQQKAKRN
jgi:hypothetical protein